MSEPPPVATRMEPHCPSVLSLQRLVFRLARNCSRILVDSQLVPRLPGSGCTSLRYSRLKFPFELVL